MVKTINIDGRVLTLKATGMTPIIYSNEYPGEDMIVEMQRLMSATRTTTRSRRGSWRSLRR